jgi:hypothetical protein
MSTAPPSADPQPLADRLASYGCTDFIRLDQKLSVPEQLDYLDLLPTRSNQTPTLSTVAEHQGTALLYLVDACGDPNSNAASLAAVRRQLANCSDPAWLGVVRAGSLEILPIEFHEAADTQPVAIIDERSPTALRNTPVWEGVDMPFCVFFARNGVPGPDHRFHYASPSYEPDLNSVG